MSGVQPREEFSDLQSLDRVVEILGIWRKRYQVEPGVGERGKESSQLNEMQRTMRNKAERARQTQLAESFLVQATVIHVPEGEIYSAAVMLTYISQWLPASDQAKRARAELAKIEKQKPEVLAVLKALGLGNR